MDGFDALLTLVILFAVWCGCGVVVEGWRWLVDRARSRRDRPADNWLGEGNTR